MNRRISILGGISSCLLAAAPHVAAAQTFAWPTDPASTVSRNTDQRLNLEITRLMRDDLSQEGEDLVPPTVGAARFTDLDGDRRNELVACVDYSGRGFYNNIIVIWQGPHRLQRKQIATASMCADVRSLLADLENDQRVALILDQYIAGFGYEGAALPAVETHIYQWLEGEFVDVSQRFPTYYANVVIPRLEAQLTKRLADKGDAHDLDRLATSIARAGQQASGWP